MTSFHSDPEKIKSGNDMNVAIRETWQRVCEEFPNATAPMVAQKVASDWNISVERVLEAFTEVKDDSLAGQRMTDW